MTKKCCLTTPYYLHLHILFTLAHFFYQRKEKKYPFHQLIPNPSSKDNNNSFLNPIFTHSILYTHIIYQNKEKNTCFNNSFLNPSSKDNNNSFLNNRNLLDILSPSNSLSKYQNNVCPNNLGWEIERRKRK